MRHLKKLFKKKHRGISEAVGKVLFIILGIVAAILVYVFFTSFVTRGEVATARATLLNSYYVGGKQYVQTTLTISSRADVPLTIVSIRAVLTRSDGLKTAEFKAGEATSFNNNVNVPDGGKMYINGFGVLQGKESVDLSITFDADTKYIQAIMYIIDLKDPAGKVITVQSNTIEIR